MAFWANRVTEPKRAYRWLMSLNGIDAWLVKSIDKPSYTLGVSEHAYLNYDFKFPGRVKWNDITLALVDPVQPDATGTMMAILEESGYVNPGEPGQAQQAPLTISKKKAVDALGSVLIKQLDADGTKGFIEVWRLENAWIKDVKFGKLDYKSEEIVEITVTLTYDWATLNPTDASYNLVSGAGEPSSTFVRPSELET